MELQALLVLCGLGVAGAAVLLLMGLFSTSGTSYEEAMAQQRKATTELLALAEGKNKPKKNTKKANKKLAKKEKHKDSVSAATGSEPESEAPAESGADDEAPPPKPHVEFRPPVVVDIPRDTPPNVKIRKRGKDPKVKPILLNKEDPSCVSDPSSPPSPAGSSLSNHFEDIHPKDEFELLHSALAAEKAAEKKEEVIEKKEVGKGNKQAKGKQGKGQPPAPAPAPAAATEPVKEEPAPLPERKPAEQPKDQRKAKKDKKAVVEAVEPEVREEVVPPLNVPQPSELTTEKLLKQVAAAPHPPHAPQAAPAHTPPPKNKKKKQEPNLLALIAAEGGGVNVSELVRLVREASLSRTEIQILTDALLNKQHDPLPQHSEWSEGPNDPMQKMKKQLADKEKALADELEASQALHAKLKELRASLNAERARAGAMARAAEEAAGEAHALQARLQRAADDNHALAQEKLMLQSKLAAEAEAQAQRVQNMEMHIQRLSESEASLVAQLAALQGEAGARAHEAAAARCELAAARDAALHAQQHAAELAQQLQEANRVCAELDAQRQSALLAEQAAAQDARAASERLAALSELQGEVQRLKSRAQLAEAATEKAKEEAEKLKQQLSAEVSSLREQLAAREAELAELRALKAAPAHNGLPAPAPAPSADLKAGELSKVEGVVAALRAELAAARAQSREQQEGAALLAAQLQAYQDKNNDLRTKNWKVMEALQSAEKALQSKPHAMPAQDSLREALSKAEAAQYSEVAAILGAACPTAAPTAAPGKAWLQAFAEQLRAQLAAPAPAPAPTPAPAPSDDLRAQNEHLQGLVDKYKTIIDDTEGVLSRLQQNVTCEERRWAAQLADKQRELDELRQRTVTQEPLAFAYSCIEKSLPTIIAEMQSKIDALEEELRQRNERNNISSFGETQKEDRLMAELSKNKLDTLNGPLQVGVEKK